MYLIGDFLLLIFLFANITFLRLFNGFRIINDLRSGKSNRFICLQFSYI